MFTYVKWLDNLLAFCIIFLGIDFLWILMEYVEFGKRMPSVSDTVIGLLFAWVVYNNYKSWGKRHGND